MKIELGGGAYPRGDGFLNVDLCDSADVKHDLNIAPWPFRDDSAEAIYSSHCIEHCLDPHVFLKECARIARVGSFVEIRCPAPHAHLAMTAGHIHVFSLQGVRNLDMHFPGILWGDGEKRLVLVDHFYQASEMLEWAKADLPFLKGLSDQVIMRWIPGTVHESVFKFEVAKR